jgi:protein TonB
MLRRSVIKTGPSAETLSPLSRSIPAAPPVSGQVKAETLPTEPLSRDDNASEKGLHENAVNSDMADAPGISAHTAVPDHSSGSGQVSTRDASFGPAAGSGQFSVSLQGSHGSSGFDEAFREKIRGSIQRNLVYPYLARKRRMEGTVLVQFSIDRKGMAGHIRVVKGSGYPILDSAARETVNKAAPFSPVAGNIEIPITFRLKNQ